MSKEALQLRLKREIGGIIASQEMAVLKAQLNAKRLGARVTVTFGLPEIWAWITRLISNGTMLSSLIDPCDISVRSAFREAAFLLEMISDTAEDNDKEYSKILAALAYDIAGYQANALFLTKGAQRYKLIDSKDEFNGANADIQLADAIFPIAQLILQKKFSILSSWQAANQESFNIQLDEATESLCSHVLQGGKVDFLDKFKRLYRASFEAGEYLANLALSLLEVRSRVYCQRSIWTNLQSAGKDLEGPWGRYAKIKTNDLYAAQRIKPVEARISRHEFWESQLAALRAGIISSESNFSVQMPTSAGKTFIGELIVLDALLSNPGNKCLYIAPFRALANQVETDLRDSLGPLGFSVSTLSGSFEIDPFDEIVISETDVLVCTPEKADMLSRVRPEYFEKVASLVVDEGHILGDLTRGPHLELLIARLRHLYPKLKIVFVSAVMPDGNARQISEWLSGAASNLIQSPLQDDNRPWEPTRKLFGFFKWDGNTSEIRFPEIVVGADEDGNAINAFARGVADRKQITYFTPKKQLRRKRGFPEDLTHKGQTCATIAFDYAAKGPTLVFTPRPDWVLSTANQLLSLIDGLELGEDPVPIQFARRNGLESMELAGEWYGVDSLQCRLLERGIGFHHGQLPDALRKAVEDDYRVGKISVLFANSTVSQGINFPIKYLIIHSLVYGKDEESQDPNRLTVRDFWNLVGRAGRAGRETEGQILFVSNGEYDEAIYKKFIDRENIEPVESVFYQLAKVFIENRASVSDESFKDVISSMVEPAIISLFVEGAVGAEEQGQIESIIGHTLFNTQMAKEPLLGPSIGLIKESIGGIPGSFQKAVADQTLRAAFAKTGIGIKSNLALVKFIESSGDTLKIPFEVGDISTFAQLCFNFLLLTEISEFHFDGTQYFQELPETRKSQILEAWLGGSSIDKILCPIDSHAERIDPDKFQKLMSEGFTYRFPWAISSLLLIMGAKYSVDLENINEKIIQLPSFMKFGVNNKVAAVFLSLGLPSRTLAVKLASIIPDYEVNFAVGWLRNLTFEELKSAGFSDREISMTIDIASNISRATQYEEVWTFDVKGIPFGADRRSLSMILLAGHALKLEREPMNQFDPFAIKVMHENSQLGYVPRGIARSIAPVLDLDGASFECIVTNIESGRDWSRVVAMARIRE